MRLIVAFFGFGTVVAWVTAVLLVAPGTALDLIWRLKPEARTDFMAMGAAGVLLLIAVGAACAASALGLHRGRTWGYRLAVGVLAVNLLGDLANAVLRHDPRTLIGLPIAGLMIWYLVRRFNSRPAPD